jgi:type IX secretion system PorP/SprF family membrane protein
MKKIIFYITALMGGLAIAIPGWSQGALFSTGYFQNQYLFNPAMSGVKNGEGALGAAYTKPTNIPNAPTTVALTGNYGFSESGAIGLNVVYDHAGLLNTTRIMGTYGYTLKLSNVNDDRLAFGLSIGGVQRRLNSGDIMGDPNDPVLYGYNDQKMKVEADLGAAYIGKSLTVQAAFPNMVSYFRKENDNVADLATFFTAVSYKIRTADDDDAIVVEPKAVFRGVKGTDNIVDFGANVTALKELINVFGMYHTSKSVTFGAGLKVIDAIQITVAYNTQASDLTAYSAGGLEFGLRYMFK